ncbi:DUF3140 domain-containing protein [Tautonia plasticadhaerens]|uniref:DNA-binding protein n=1 Tax=Tautonia plasticadhaerens TaxID=2527974 RepID=A0A518GW62_9BACT|nr:DUF3140 domain-containing protein [Tautonia plasticadhaerens]QDV32833.1 hypothetical protein ElP_06730 [Tautonia plasticadhaerens]
MAQSPTSKPKPKRDGEQTRRDETIASFKAHVNMSASQVEAWLKTKDSRSVGRRRSGEDEAVGHKSGRRIVEILRTRKAEYGDDDFAHMRKVVGYIKRHLKQRPSGDVADTRWRYSLMNWGHDPLKD